MQEYTKVVKDTIFDKFIKAEYVNFINCTFKAGYDCSHCRFENCNFIQVCITFNSDHINCKYGLPAAKSV